MTDFGASSYRRFLQGDKRALETLVRMYSDCLTQYAYLFVRNFADAEDIMEESFAALIAKPRNIPDGARFKAYLYKTARNKCLDFLRSKKRTERPLSDYEDILRSEDVEGKIESAERDRKVFECLCRLGEPYREVLYFTYFDGFTANEIGTLLKKSRKQVYNLLARAKLRLKTILEEEGFGENL